MDTPQFFTKGNLVQIKEHAPWVAEMDTNVLLNPLARAAADSHGSFSFPKHLPASASSPPSGNAAIATKLIENATSSVHGVGTDVELISSVPHTNESFLTRNFTPSELAYCRSAPDFRASLAGRWSAKEAVFKSLKTESKGGAAAMIEIEIVASETGPKVVLHGEAKKVAEEKGVSKFELSVSHSDDVAIAVVVASA